MRFGSNEVLAWQPLARVALLTALLQGAFTPDTVLEEGADCLIMSQSTLSAEQLDAMRMDIETFNFSLAQHLTRNSLGWSLLPCLGKC